METKQKTWSYSSLGAYKQCPHKWMYQRVVKMPEAPSYHLTRGNDIHKMAEEYLNGVIISLPPVLSKFAKEFEQLKANGAIAEQELCLDKDWKLVEDGWQKPETWLRLKIDATVQKHNLVIDFKTGKQYDEHINQARLYANVYLLLNTDVEEVDVEFWYLDSGEVKGWTFLKTDLDFHINDWNSQVEEMHNDETFAPKPNKWCKYCYVKHLCSGYE